MGLGISFGQDIQVVGVMAPIDIVATDVNTTELNVSNAHHVTFIVSFGVLTGDSMTVFVRESAQATTVSAEKIPFKYRLGAEIDTGDSWDAVSSADSGGLIISASKDNTLLMIDVDPATLTEGDSYLSLFFVTASGLTVTLVSVVAFLEPRYPQLDHITTV